MYNCRESLNFLEEKDIDLICSSLMYKIHDQNNAFLDASLNEWMYVLNEKMNFLNEKMNVLNEYFEWANEFFE